MRDLTLLETGYLAGLLLLSLLLRPPDTAGAPQLSLVCALAVAECVEATTGLEARVRWPNDVLVGGRKVAGILLEGHEDAVVCGIGVNVSQTEAALPRDARTPAASLRTLTGREQDRAALLVLLLERLESCYDTWLACGLAPMLPELDRRNVLRGREVRVGENTGSAGAITERGQLTLTHADGTTTLVVSGEVTEGG